MAVMHTADISLKLGDSMDTRKISQMQPLEARKMLSVTTPVIAETGGILRVAATDFDDTIIIGLAPGGTHVEVKITGTHGTNVDDASTAVAGLTRIRVHGLAGDDHISIDNTNGPLNAFQVVLWGDAGD